MQWATLTLHGSSAATGREISQNNLANIAGNHLAKQRSAHGSIAGTDGRRKWKSQCCELL